MILCRDFRAWDIQLMLGQVYSSAESSIQAPRFQVNYVIVALGTGAHYSR